MLLCGIIEKSSYPHPIRKLIITLRKESLRKIGQIVKKYHAMVQYLINSQKELQTSENRQCLCKPKKLNTVHKRAIRS